jgi:heavy metal translocating P-type ATPase
MFLSALVATGGAIAGYLGVECVVGQRKQANLLHALAPSVSTRLPPRRSDRFVVQTQSLLKSLTPDRLVPAALRQQTGALLQQVDDRYQLLIHNSIDRLFGDHYEKHLKALGGTSGVDAIPPIVKERNRQAGYAGLSFLLVLTGAPLLVMTSFAINFYLGLVMIRIGLQDMWEKRTLTTRGRNVLVYLGCMVSGLLAVQSLFLAIGLLMEKLIDTVQGQSHERLVNLLGTLPQTVWCIREGVTVSCPLAEIQAGDVVVVHAGEVVPVDGVILAGHAGIDQHMLTGEAQPVDKETGDTVFASTLVLMGEIQVQVAKANAETLAAQITTILNNTKSHNTQVGLRGEQIADNLVYATTAIGVLAWPLWGVSSMLAVWSVELGSMLMFTTPLTLLGYLDMSARSNILIKDGRSLELLSSINTVVFDKTGTLTQEQPTVCAIHVCGDLSKDELLALAAAIEQRQSHPVAVAIRSAATAQGLALPVVDETRIEVGYGLAVALNERRVLLGSQRYMNLNEVLIADELQHLIETQQAGGHSLVYLAVDGVLQGMIELQPTLRPEVQSVVSALHARGLQLVMITGDQEAPAQALAATLGIDRVFANVLPEGKAELVKQLQTQGRKVMFVGDGINDSIALKQAEVSVSIMGATTVATDTAQIVLMDHTLSQLDTLFDMVARYERDLQAQYILGIHIPAGYIAGVLAFGWGMVSSCVVGYIVFLTATGLAFRPIWRQERMEAKPHPSPVQTR